MQREKTLVYIDKIISGKITRPELRKFIELCSSIALAILENRHAKLARIFYSNGYSFDDIAVDSITYLFIAQGNIDTTGIQKALSNWKKKITTAADADFFIYQLISKRVDQTLSKLMNEIDPLYGKILRDLYYPSKINRYKKVYYFGQAYLVEIDNHIINKEIIDEKQLDEIPVNYQNKLKNIIGDLFKYLKEHTDYFPAIPINPLILKIKSSFSEILFKQSGSTDIQIVIEINNAIINSLNTINNRLYDQYVKREILTASAGEQIKKALIDIASDLKDGGINRGIEEYLIPYFPDLSKENLRERYHNIFDYLIRLLKKEIARELNNTSFPN